MRITLPFDYLCYGKRTYGTSSRSISSVESARLYSTSTSINPHKVTTPQTTTKMRRHGRQRTSPFLVSLFLTLLSCLHLPREAAGDASDSLLGGQYQPTTNIDHIIQLTELIEAIQLDTNGLAEAELFYRTESEGVSLETLSNSNADDFSYSNPSHFLDQRYNPLYGIFMYGLWRGVHGNGRTGTDMPRESMKFLSKPVDFYPHTIIQAEFEKASGYDAQITAETIRVTNMWMATVQALYNGVQMCDDRPDDFDEPNFVNPIDMAAAFWIGTQEDESAIGGSLHAWANDIGSKFTGQDVNVQIVQGLKSLQTSLQNCLTAPLENTYELGANMRAVADNITRWMTVPLVQNLLWHSTNLEDANKRDYVVLYGLMTLPPIIVCDDKAFSDLYDDYVVDVKREATPALALARAKLESRYTCLGIDCNMVGEAVFTLPGDACKDPELNIHGYVSANQELREVATIDLDVRTIGTLVEMDAAEAAYDVYHWGRFSRIGLQGGYYPLQKYATGQSHPSNTVATAFSNHFAKLTHPSDNIVDDAILGKGAFVAEIPRLRRVIAEASMVTILLHIYALDSMYQAIDNCDVEAWDRATASLTGWAEGTENARGLLFLSIGRFLCSRTASCEVANSDHGEDSRVNKLIMLALKTGRDAIESEVCDEAKEEVSKIETLILTELVDATAYFAQQVVENPSNNDNKADLYGLAWALIPLIKDPDAEQTIRTNVGLSVNTLSQPMVDQVLAALKTFVSEANISCSLLDTSVCDAESLIPQTGSSDVSSASNAGASSQPLLSYTPSSNVESIIQLTIDIENIQALDDKEASYTIYDKGDTVSLKGISTNQYFSSWLRTTNPMYSLYMFSLWKSASGGTADGGDKEFDDQPVEFFGNSIAEDEYNKPSGYNPELTGETMRVAIMWMATVQSIYEGVEFCSTMTAENYHTLVNPIDKAAAFWIGDQQDAESMNGGSLYSWANKMHQLFIDDKPGFDPNSHILENLKQLRSDLDLCLEESKADAEKEEILERMWSAAKVTTTAMTVPLMQNFLYSLAVQAGKAVSPNSDQATNRDTMILFALMTLPQLMVCDETGFKVLYERTILDSTNFDSNLLSRTVATLQNNYACMGFTCAAVGKAPFMVTDWPACQDPAEFSIAGYQQVSAQTMGVAKVDIDIRTIGMLLEIEAYDAAANVYKYGGMFRDAAQGFSSLQSLALSQPKSAKGTEFKGLYDDVAANEDILEAFNAKSPMFQGVSNFQRRVMTEASLVAISSHIYAIDSLFWADELCDDNGSDAVKAWDTAVAALVGWTEGAQDGGSSDNGVLFYNIAQYLCKEAGKCNMANDSEVNRSLMSRLKEGKQMLFARDCVSAYTQAMEIEKLLQTILVDTVAFFAQQIVDDNLDQESIVEGYVFAIALAPIIKTVDSAASSVILSNLGTFPNDNMMKDGIAGVLGALRSFVTKADIDCALLTTPICQYSATTNTNTPVVADNNGFLPGSGDEVDSSPPTDNQNGASGPGSLLGGAYTPTTNVDRIIKLTDKLDMIANAETADVARAYYTQIEDGISLQSLSTRVEWEEISKMNPLYVLYMYGLWNSESGDNDGDGYSNKMFDDKPLLPFGDTIVTDEIEKDSGFDAKLTAETISLVNVWMAITSELYQAVAFCRDGITNSSERNPIDDAAAFWFGSQTDPNMTTGSSLFAWAKRAQAEFTGFASGVNDEMIEMLSSLQESYASCKSGFEDHRKDRALVMKTDVDYTIQIMTIPLVQNFIRSLASMSGTTTQALDDRSNYLVLYSLMVLPLISICDEITFDELWESTISDNQGFTAVTFSEILKLVQDRFQCLGMTCSMVGRSLDQGSTWPECIDNSASSRLELAGYTPATDESLGWSTFDLDISTMLSFIVMDASPLAADIYDNGRNVDDISSGKYFSINDIRTPSTNDIQDIWSALLAEGNRYSPTTVTRNAIEGKNEFEATSPLKNSAAASLALATIDMHIATLDSMYEAKSACNLRQQQQASSYWDRAAAITIGWAEGTAEGGSDTDGHLLFQIAQELCEQFDSCDENGHSKINNLVVEEFRNGLQYARTLQCDRLQSSIDTITKLFQAILVDNLAFHTQFSSDSDNVHCLLAYVSANAVVPFLRAVEPELANTVETRIRVDSVPLTCVVEDTDAIYSSLKTFVTSSAINCNLLGSQVCGLDPGETPIDVNQNTVYTSNDSGHTVANGEYVPDVDVKDLSSLKTVLQGICSAGDGTSARQFYDNEFTTGLSIKSMSLNAKYEMTDDLLFNQYVYALYDDVDKTDGSFMFDGRPATEYAHTIANDALDAGIITTGCVAVKVLHVWMFIVHKLLLAVKQCDDDIPENYGAIDEAATLWESGLLFDMAEELGPKFGHQQTNGMTYLNRQIVDRFKKAQAYHQDKTNSCKSKNAIGGLRIIVNEIVSYMTAVLIQQLIDAMVDISDSNTQENMVELMSFAVLPRIMGCGHEMLYDDVYDKLATRNFDSSSVPFATAAIHSHLNCLGLTCDDIGSANGISLYPPCSDNFDIAGYVPVSPKSANMIAKLDLDAVAINQMIQLERYDIARNIYFDGHNYYDYDKEDIGFVSLHGMTQSSTIGYTTFPQYELYSNYLKEKGIGNNPGDFAHQLFMDATTPNRFANASTEERRSAVEITLASFVSYFSALEALYYATFVCPTNKDSATAAYDGGVAFLIGSVEGTERGGNSEQEGRFFYNVAKMACIYFDTCVEGDDAEINKMMLDTLIVGQNALKSSNCAGVTEAVDTFATLTVVPLMQSLLSFADDSDNRPDGYVASMAIAPVVWDVDDSLSVKIVGNMAYDAISPDKSQVNSAINTVLADQDFEGIACYVISSLCEEGGAGGVDISPEEPVPIKPEEPMPISDGLYVATTYIGDKSAIALDVKEIEERLQVKDVDRATFIYEEGMNSKIYDNNGMPTSAERSIQDFSLNSGRSMLRDPTYNLFITGLSDEYNEFLGKPVEDYGDSYVSTLLYSASPLAADAMVAINIWMEVTHSLHSAYEACKSSILSENRSADGRQLQESKVATRFIDEAAAYWIGDGQATGSSSNGHLLYALTEIISEEYGESSSSQSSINTRIIDLLQQAKSHIAISRSCTTSTDSHLKLRSIIDEIIPLMAIPLLRSLLHAMKKDDTERVKIYAIAVLPLFAKCNPSTYLELKNDIIDNTLLSTEKNYVYSRIISLYDCLGISCDLIGKLTGDDFAYKCEDGSSEKSLAGYRYVADQDVISSAAKIDTEIRLLEIYINNGMEHFPDDMESLFGLAYERYRFGNGNATGEGSLRRLARDVRRDVVPSFPQFRRYFKSDENYADKIIVDAFEEGGIFRTATADYRKRVILFTTKYMVTHMAILQKLYSAVMSCKIGDVSEGITNLDMAAAYYTGSFEGTEDGGSFDGSLNFFLARRMCIYFDTCSQSDNALSNERMISLFYSAQGELDTMACGPLERTVKQIDNALLIPLIQGTLFAAWQNSYYFNKNVLVPSTQEFLPEGYVLAQSILPIIANVDIDAAKEIDSVMVDDFPFPTREKVSNHAAVFSAVKRAITKMDGIDCKQIGKIGGQGFCPGDAEPTSPSSRVTLSSIMILTTMALSVFIF